MTSAPLNMAASVVLNGSGGGTVKITANVGQRFDLSVAAVRTSTQVKTPICRIYIGGAPVDANFVDGTYTGNLDATSFVAGHPVTPNNSVWAVWEGGDVGAVATLSIFGTLNTP